jgi:hypothetical protein
MAINYGQRRSLTARELISALIRDGLVFDRQSGAHQHYLPQRLSGMEWVGAREVRPGGAQYARHRARAGARLATPTTKGVTTPGAPFQGPGFIHL